MERKLLTIQKSHVLNEVFAYDEIDEKTGINYLYAISTVEEPADILIALSFQKGPRGSLESTEGILDQDLLEVVRDRLRHRKNNSRELSLALTNIETALFWLNKRIEDRHGKQS